MVFLSQGNAGLVQQTVVETNVLTFRLTRNLHYLEGLQRNAVRLCKGHDISDKDSCTAAETAHRDGAFEGTSNTVFQFKTLLKGKLGTAGVVSPISLLHQRRRSNIKLHMPGECFTVQGNFAAIHHIKPQVYSFINGKAGHQTMLVIYVRTQGAHSIGGEDMVLHGL